MAKLFGIEFAPLWIPLERRLQTLAAFQFISMFLFYGLLSFLLTYYLIAYTRFWWVGVLYLVWYVIDQPKVHKGGRRHLLAVGKYIGFFAVRKWKIWNYFRDYFPIQMIKTCDLDPTKCYIFGYHPHGLVSIGAFCSFVTDAGGFPSAFPGLTSYLLTLRCWFYFPFLREVLLFAGLSASSRENIDSLLRTPDGTQRTGKCVVIVVGGAQEALYANPGSHTLVLSKRFGFIKKAIQHGSPLVPVFAFGENDLFFQKLAPEGSFMRKCQNAVRKIFTFSTPLFWGRGVFNYTFGLLPRRQPVSVVIGGPVEPKRVLDCPSAEEIQELHGRYVQALVSLFEEHKARFGLPEDAHLDIL